MSQCNERSKQTASAIKYEGAYAKRYSSSSSGDVVLLAALNLTYRRLRGYDSTVTNIKRQEVLVSTAHGGVGRVLALLCNYTTAEDLFSHSRIVMGLRSVCVPVCILSNMFINIYLLVLWLKRLLNLHILFVYLQHDNVYLQYKSLL